MTNPKTEENNGFGPIFQRRGSRTTWVSIAVLGAFLLVGILAHVLVASKDGFRIEVYVFSLALSMLSFLAGELIRRLCLFSEEYRHINTRYEGSWKEALKVTFAFKNIQFVVFCGIVAVTITLIRHDHKHDLLCHFIINSVFVPLIFHLLGLRELSKVEKSELSERENMNVADGLAWSYYFGYLKIVLPELKNRINATEKYRYKINPEKLFIILPKNCYMYDSISNEHSDPRKRVHIDGNLDPVKRNRGGILNRVYHHTVYRIEQEEEEPKYCIMEYATPLMTLYDMSKDDTACLSSEEREQQVVLFIRKLKEILDNDHACRGTYELITLSGEDKDIGDIILRALYLGR